MEYIVNPGIVVKNKEISYSPNKIKFNTDEVINNFSNKSEIDAYCVGISKKVPTPEELTNILCFNEDLIGFFYDKMFMSESSFEDKFFMIKGFLSRKDFSFENCYFSDKDRISENVYIIPVTTEASDATNLSEVYRILDEISFLDYSLKLGTSGITDVYYDKDMTKKIEFVNNASNVYKDRVYLMVLGVRVCIKNYDIEKNKKVPNVYADQENGSIIGIDGTMEWDINGRFEQFESAYNVFRGNVTVNVRYIGETDYTTVVFLNGKRNLAPTMVSKNERSNDIEFLETGIEFKILESDFYQVGTEWSDFHNGRVFYGNNKIQFRIKPSSGEISEILEVEFFGSDAPKVQFDYNNRKFSCPDADILYYKMNSGVDFKKFDDPAIPDDFEGDISFKFLDSQEISFHVDRKKRYIVGSEYRIFRGTKMKIVIQGEAVDGTKTKEFKYDEMYEQNIRECGVFSFRNDGVTIDLPRGNVGVCDVRLDVNSETQKYSLENRYSTSIAIPAVLIEGKANLVEVFYKEYNDADYSLWKSQEVRVRQTKNEFVMIYNDHIDAGTVKLKGFKKNGEYAFYVNGEETIFTVENYSTHEEVVDLPYGFDPDAPFLGGLKLKGIAPDLDSDINLQRYHINFYPSFVAQETYFTEKVNGSDYTVDKTVFTHSQPQPAGYEVNVKMLYIKDMDGYDEVMTLIDEGDPSKFIGKAIEDLPAIKGQFHQAMKYFIYAYCYDPITGERGPWSKFDMGHFRKRNFMSIDHMASGINTEPSFDNNYKEDFSYEMENNLIFSGTDIVMNLNTFFDHGYKAEEFFIDIEDRSGNVFLSDSFSVGEKNTLDITELKSKLYLGETRYFYFKFYYKNLLGERVDILTSGANITKPLFGMAAGIFVGDDSADDQEIVVAVMPYSENAVDGGIRNSEVMGLLMDNPTNYGIRYWEGDTAKYDSYIDHKSYLMREDSILNDVTATGTKDLLGDFVSFNVTLSETLKTGTANPYSSATLTLSGIATKTLSNGLGPYPVANSPIKIIKTVNGSESSSTIYTDEKGKYSSSISFENDTEGGSSAHPINISIEAISLAEQPSNCTANIPGDGTIRLGDGVVSGEITSEMSSRLIQLASFPEKIGINDTVFKIKEFGDDGHHTRFHFMACGKRNSRTYQPSYGPGYTGGMVTAYSSSIYDRIQFRPIFKDFKNTPGFMRPLFCTDFGTEEFIIKELEGKKFLVYKHIGAGNRFERAIADRLVGSVMENYPANDPKHRMDRSDGGYRKPENFDPRNILCVYAADANSVDYKNVTMIKRSNILTRFHENSGYSVELNDFIDSLVSLASNDLERND